MPQACTEFNQSSFKDMFVRVLLLLAMSLGTVMLPAGESHAEIRVSKKTRYFTIGGRTAAELDRELSLRGPARKGSGTRHPGLTRIRFGGAATYQEKGGWCAVQKAEVSLSLEIILPKWRGRNRADERLGLIWDTLSADIKRHEERHAEIARQRARDVEAAILNLPRQRSCSAIQKQVSAVTAQEMKRHEAEQIRFDRIEALNFEKRMIRLLKNRSAKMNLD